LFIFELYEEADYHKINFEYIFLISRLIVPIEYCSLSFSCSPRPIWLGGCSQFIRPV